MIGPAVDVAQTRREGPNRNEITEASGQRNGEKGIAPFRVVFTTNKVAVHDQAVHPVDVWANI